MIRRIYKYPILSLYETLELANPKFLSIQVQGTSAVLWVEVDMDEGAKYVIQVLLTGDEVLPDYNYISTLQLGEMVYHFYWSKI